MNPSSPSPSEKFSFQQAAITAGIFALITLLVHLSNFQRLTTFLSTYMLPVIAILCAAFTFAIWRRLRNHQQANRILQGFWINFTLWAAAEVSWLVFVILDIDPYPSIADLFWILGYLPLIYTLVLNVRFLEVRLSHEQFQIILAVMLVGGALTFYLVLLPIILDFSFDRLLEVIISLLYPLLDLILIYQAIHLFFIARKSRFSISWLVVALALGITALADLGFAYTDWIGIYSSEHDNLISRLVDWGYLAGYPIFALGIYSYYLGNKPGRVIPHTIPLEIPPVVHITNTTYLIFTNGKNEVIDFSSNLWTINPQVTKAPLTDFFAALLGRELGASQEIVQKILDQVTANHSITDFPLQLRCSSGNMYDAWLSGIEIQDVEKYFNGMNLAIRIYIPGAMQYEGLEKFDLGIVRHINSRCGIQEFPFQENWIGYFDQYIQMLYHHLEESMGEPVAQKMIEHLNNSALQKGWNIKISPRNIQMSVSLGDVELLSILTHLILQAGNYASRLVGEETVRIETNNMERDMNKTILLLARDYGLSK